MQEQTVQRTKHKLDAQVGEELGPVEYQVTEKMVRDYINDVSEDGSSYFAKSPFGVPIAPATFIARSYSELLAKAGYHSQGSVYTGGIYEFTNPIRVGKVIKLRGKVVDRYNKRGRDYIVVETVITDEDGLEIGRTRCEELQQRVA